MKNERTQLQKQLQEEQQLRFELESSTTSVLIPTTPLHKASGENSTHNMAHHGHDSSKGMQNSTDLEQTVYQLEEKVQQQGKYIQELLQAQEDLKKQNHELSKKDALSSSANQNNYVLPQINMSLSSSQVEEQVVPFQNPDNSQEHKMDESSWLQSVPLISRVYGAFVWATSIITNDDESSTDTHII